MCWVSPKPVEGIKLIVQEQLDQFLHMRWLPSECVGAWYFKTVLSFLSDFAADVASPTQKAPRNPLYFNKKLLMYSVQCSCLPSTALYALFVPKMGRLTVI